MIKTFLCKETEKIFNRSFSGQFPAEVQHLTAMKMRMLNRAYTQSDLKNPPRNRFELVRSGNTVKYSLTIKSSWKLNFTASDGNLFEVELTNITVKNSANEKSGFQPVHPGEILENEFLKPLNLSQNKLAIAIKVPPRRINEIVLRKRKITADTAIKLAKYFDMSPEFWMGLQSDYELDIALQE